MADSVVQVQTECSLDSAHKKCEIVLETSPSPPEDPTPTLMSSIVDLEVLLRRVADARELQSFVRKYYPNIEAAVTWNQPFEHLLGDLVSALDRHGALDGELFNRLMRWRPGQTVEIIKTGRQLGILPQEEAATSVPSASGTRKSSSGTANVSQRIETLHFLLWSSALLALYVYIFAFGPSELPLYKQKIVAVVSALLSAALGANVVGTIGVRFGTPSSAWGARATGGFACFLITLFLTFPAPVDTPAVEPPESNPESTSDTRDSDSSGDAENVEHNPSTASPSSEKKPVEGDEGGSYRKRKCNLQGAQVLLETPTDKETDLRDRLSRKLNDTYITTITVPGARSVMSPKIYRHIADHSAFDVNEQQNLDSCIRSVLGATGVIYRASRLSGGQLYHIVFVEEKF